MRKPGLLVVSVILICVSALLVSGVPAQDDLFTAFCAARMRIPVRSEPVTLVVVGDIMLSRGVADRVKEHEDPSLPFAKVASLLLSGDIVFGNLENPLTSGPEIDIREMVLRADPEMADALARAGFTLLSLANNHVPDFGEAGILDTLQNLDRAGIAWVGAGPDSVKACNPKIIEIRGLRLAFLAFTDPEMAPAFYEAGDDTPGTASIEASRMEAAIKEALLIADFVAVSLHTGTEYEAEPDGFQVESAHAAIDAGADLVIGHHPHVVQPIERYRDRYILYSLGNFVFDQWWSEETCQGLMARLTISQAGVERMEFLPTLINKNAQPESLTGPEASAVLSKLGLELDKVTIGSLDDTAGATTSEFGYLDLRPREAVRYRLIKEQNVDLDQDGVLESVALRDGCLTVRAAGPLIWETPKTWLVDNFILGDANSDGIPDLSLSVWKSGSFGPCKPFWVAEDDPSVKNHLFIFNLANGAIKPMWQSSNLDRPICQMELIDLDGDGQNELLVVEGDYDDPQARRMGVWEWNDWGFYKVSEP